MAETATMWLEGPAHTSGAEMQHDGGTATRVKFGDCWLRTHGSDACRHDEACVIHRPSKHQLGDRPLNWRGDTFPPLMERICEHGVGHPDPDALAHELRRAERLAADNEIGMHYDWVGNAKALGVHGCDGCC